MKNETISSIHVEQFKKRKEDDEENFWNKLCVKRSKEIHDHLAFQYV